MASASFAKQGRQKQGFTILSAIGSFRIARIYRNLTADILSRPSFAVAQSAGHDLAKPFGEVTILMFDLGDKPPSTGGKT
jgi:hypothetical protein